MAGTPPVGGWSAASVGRDLIRLVTIRALVTSGLFLLSVPAALLGLPVAVVFWVGVIPLARALVVRLLRVG